MSDSSATVLSILPEGALPERDAAAAINRDVQTLRRLTRRGEGPDYIRLGRFRYYRPEALRRWLLSLERPSKPPPEPPVRHRGHPRRAR